MTTGYGLKLFITDNLVDELVVAAEEVSYFYVNLPIDAHGLFHPRRAMRCNSGPKESCPSVLKV
jgi:hypothetical protein